MDQAFLHPIGILNGAISPMTALCFMLNNNFTYLLGGSCHGCFWIYDLASRTKLNQIVLKHTIISIHHHPTQGYEIITQELFGRLTFWHLTDTFRFVAYHTVYGDTQPLLSIISDNHILFPQNYRIRILKLDELKCIVPKTTELCDFIDWKFGKHTTLLPIEVNNQPYVISGYTSGSLIVREFKPGGNTIRLNAVRPALICSIAYNEERRELMISDNNSFSLGVIHICTGEDGNLDLRIQEDIYIGSGNSILKMEPRNIFLLCGRDMMTIFNRKSSECLSIAPLQFTNSIQVFACSPATVEGWNNYVFAVAYTNGFISLWTFDNYVQYVPCVLST